MAARPGLEPGILPPSPEANPSIGGFASRTNPPQAEKGFLKTIPRSSKSAPSGLEPETLPPKGSVIPFHHGATQSILSACHFLQKLATHACFQKSFPFHRFRSSSARLLINQGPRPVSLSITIISRIMPTNSF